MQSIANLVTSYHHPGVQFYIYCGNKDLDGTKLEDVFFDTWTIFNEHTTIWYASEHCQTKKQLDILVDEIAPDVIFINGIYSYPFTILPLLYKKAPRKIISARGMLHPGALSQKSLKKKIWIQGWKLLGWHHCYEFHATSEEEKNFIRDVFGKNTEVFVAGNYPRQLKHLASPVKLVGEINLISIGLISPMKNILLVLQALQQCRSTVKYNIYGPVKDAAYWNNCLQLIKILPQNVQVENHGDIEPGRIAEILSRHHVFILPSKSENFGHAIYEALSAGKPVITSTKTPWNHLEEKGAGKNVSFQITDITYAIDFFAGLNEVEFTKWSNDASEYATAAINLDVINDQYDWMFLKNSRNKTDTSNSKVIID